MITQGLQKEARFLLDTGSDLNMIKIACHKDDVLVDEKKHYKLKGIN